MVKGTGSDTGWNHTWLFVFMFTFLSRSFCPTQLSSLYLNWRLNKTYQRHSSHLTSGNINSMLQDEVSGVYKLLSITDCTFNLNLSLSLNYHSEIAPRPGCQSLYTSVWSAGTVCHTHAPRPLAKEQTMLLFCCFFSIVSIWQHLVM